MSNQLLTKLYVETNWEEFIVPFYDMDADIVYATVYTNITSLNPQDTWNKIFKDHVLVITEQFKEKKYFTVTVEKTDIKIELPIKKGAGFCKTESATEEKTVVNSSIFFNDKKSIDPRPAGVVKLLYRVESASSHLNITKILKDFNEFQQSKGVPPLASSFDDDEPQDTDFSKLTSFQQISDMKNLGDFNELLRGGLAKSNQLKVAALSSNGLNGNAGSMNLAGEIRKDFQQEITVNRNSIMNQTLSDTEYLGDQALFLIPALSSGLSEVGANDASKRLNELRKKHGDKLSSTIAFLNKWGISGLLECLLANMIEGLRLQGNVSEARKLIEQLKELQKTYKAIKVDVAEYKKIFNNAQDTFFKNQKDLGETIKKALWEGLWEMIKQVMNLFLQECLMNLASSKPVDDFDFGAITPAEVLASDQNVTPSFPADYNPDALKNAAKDPAALAALKAAILKQMNALLNTVFKNLTGQEVCRLMEGMAETKLLLFVESQITKYEVIKPLFPNLQSIADYFYKLGTESGTSFCDKVNKDAEAQSSKLVDYCGSKINETLAELYKDKLPNPNVQPDFPSINAEDLMNLLGEDYFQNALPPFDYLPFLKQSYKTAQENLYQYENLFSKDLSVATTRGSKNKTPGENSVSDDEKAATEAGLKELDAKGKGKDIFSQLKIGKSKESIKFEPFAVDLSTLVKSSEVDKSTEFTLVEGGPFSAVNILANGDYDIETFVEGLSITGTATKNKKSPLTTIGNLISDQYQQQMNPAFRVFKHSVSGGPLFTVSDLYKDALFSIVDVYIKEANKRIKEVTDNPSDFVEFYRIQRRKRVKEILCVASKTEKEAQRYIPNEKKAMDIESLQILIYLFLLESYPNLVVTASASLPETISNNLLEISVGGLGLIAEQFKELVVAHLVDIPVRNLMCEAGLTLEEMIEDELKFISQTYKSGQKLPTVKESLKNRLAVDLSDGEILYPPNTFLQDYLNKWGDQNADSFSVKKFSFFSKYLNKLEIKKEAKTEVKDFFEHSFKKEKTSFVFDADLFSEVFFGILTSLYTLLEKDAHPVDNKPKFETLINEFLFKSTLDPLQRKTSGAEKKGFQYILKAGLIYETQFIKLGLTIPLGKTNISTPVEIKSNQTKSILDGPAAIIEEIKKGHAAKAAANKISDNFARMLAQVAADAQITHAAATVFSGWKKLSIEDMFSGIPEIEIDNPILDAFDENFVSLITSYFLKDYASAEHKKQQKIFDQLKSAIMSRFSNGAETVAIADDAALEEAHATAAALQKINSPNLKLADLTDLSFWTIIVMIIPKLVFSALKAIALSALYFSNPIVYALLILADMLGFSLEELLEKKKQEVREAILETLDPSSPEAVSLRQQIAKNQKENPIEQLKCDI